VALCVPSVGTVRPLPSSCPAGAIFFMTWTPWHFLVMAVSGWMNREQQVIGYAKEVVGAWACLVDHASVSITRNVVRQFGNPGKGTRSPTLVPRPRSWGRIIGDGTSGRMPILHVTGRRSFPCKGEGPRWLLE